ncbi:MAG TPA: 2Fe-2S iron-sulfur cluster-binding protein [Longimicrobiales bacterium]
MAKASSGGTDGAAGKETMATKASETAVTCTINGVQVTVPKGTRIIEAAERAGIGIPHYCYHPGLSAPAMCRMCLVEIEGAPKLTPACVTEVADGQVIRTETERAREARTGVLEFYLINHPLDCPICDKSGECKLQDYAAQEGRKHGRFLEQKRVFGRDDFGGDILYEGTRCIMCTRCVRFMREIAGDDALCVVQRGHRSVIDTFYDRGVEGSLWAGNIVDICPVGALLSKDFLHKARAWDLDRTNSICPNCSQGCNIRIETRDDVVQRLKPRENPEVNSYWMCDYGRLGYEWLNRGRVEATGAEDAGAAERVEAPLVRDESGKLVAASWQQAMLALVERLREVRGAAPVYAVGSPFHANEDNGLLARLVAALGGEGGVFRSARAEDEVVCPGFPKLARRRDLSANARGLEVLGLRRTGDDDAHGGLDAPDGGVLLVLGDALADQPADFGAGARLFVYLGDSLSPAARNADFVLPITTFAEQEGTFTNFEGRVQRFWPALRPRGLARPAWQVLGVALAGLDDTQAPATAADAFLLLGETHDAFRGLSYEQIGARGALLNTMVGRIAATAEEA